MNFITRNEALALNAAAKGTQHGYLAGAYTKLTVGKAVSGTGKVAAASLSYTGSFLKNVVVGFKKTP